MKTPPPGAIALVASLALFGCEEDPYQTEDTSTNTAAVRVINKVTDVPSIDFCVRREGGDSWLGPVMQQMLQQPDGLPASQETGYMPLAGGIYTARIVDPSLNLCSPSWTGDDRPLEVVEGLRYAAEVTGSVDPSDDVPVDLITHEE